MRSIGASPKCRSRFDQAVLGDGLRIFFSDHPGRCNLSEVSWTAVPAGTHVLTARTTDGQGATTTSAARTIIVDAAPTVSLAATPLNAVAPASVTLTATASDADGTIAQVEFLQGAAVVATLSAPPYVTTATTSARGVTFSRRAPRTTRPCQRPRRR